jgi:ubiquinone/menaquinone biosynthesis C-methylase UbiE
MPNRFLSREEIRTFYDRFGAKQDWQRFYEGAAIRALLKEGRFEAAESVFELGCGTGAFAEELLANHLPKNGRYVGVDISSAMVELTRKRLARFKDRGRVCLSEGTFQFEQPKESVDRFVANYVMDLLPPEDIEAALDEAYRLLNPDGRLCLISLTFGRTWFSQMVTWAWDRIHRLHPAWVGGCRPVELLEFVRGDRWRVTYRNVVVAFGIPSEIVIAAKGGMS